MPPVAEMLDFPAPGPRDYAALRAGAVVIDRSDRARWRFTGPNAAETLNGLVTNDVLALGEGAGLYAAALTAKGKIVADLRILRDGDGYMADTGAAAAEGWRAITRKFINPRVAPFTEISGTTCDVGVFGADAAELVARAVEGNQAALESMTAHSHFRARLIGSEVEVTIVRAVDLGEVPGFDIIAPEQAAAGLQSSFLALGAVPASAETFDTARIEAGVALWGTDMTDDTLAQEANLDEVGAISFSKGCYVGQEVVARIHFRGHVNKRLRRLSFGSDVIPPPGSELVDESGKTVGDIRSSANSPGSGGVGIGMVRREVQAGATLIGRGPFGTVDVTVI